MGEAGHVRIPAEEPQNEDAVPIKHPRADLATEHHEEVRTDQRLVREQTSDETQKTSVTTNTDYDPVV